MSEQAPESTGPYSFEIGNKSGYEMPPEQELEELSAELKKAKVAKGIIDDDITITYCGKSINMSHYWELTDEGNDPHRVSQDGVDNVIKEAAEIITENKATQKAKILTEQFIEKNPREELELKEIKICESKLILSISLGAKSTSVEIPINNSYEENDLSVPENVAKLYDDIEIILGSLLSHIIETTENFPKNIKERVTITIQPRKT